MAATHVLIVDERPHTWVSALADAGYETTTVLPQEASALLDRIKFGAVLAVATSSVDPVLHTVARASERGLAVALLSTAAVDAERAADAGAAVLVELPVEPSEAPALIRRALRICHAVSVAEAPSILGESKAIRAMRETITRAAVSTATVLVRGESGTGKELVARALHAESPRAAGPLVTIHSGALPETLLESEMFGYEKGAFTGATATKTGRVEAAQGGTIFLDEIGDVTATTQVKLLRLLQDRTYQRVGGNRTLTADVRFVAATHRDLEGMVREGTFREDLFYRLSVVPIWTPPLRARHGDIPLLARAFCERLGKANGRQARLTDDAVAVIAEQRWPGNVRQLQNFLERLVVLSDTDEIDAAQIRREIGGRTFATGSIAPVTAAQTALSLVSQVIPLDAAVRRAERRAIVKALEQAEGNKSLAARLLEINRGTLYNKMREYGLA